jgi:hypothetical protein
MRLVKYFAHNVLVLVGLVLIWRGVWYLLDEMDILFLGRNHIITTIGGIILGFIILYLPDKDLKEISNL